MESNEEYLLRALRRTSSELADSLIPAHGVKLTKLLDKFERADSVEQEVQTLLQVQGFGKCALAMEWLLERTKRSDDNFVPEQFESDTLLLNEKLFEAFLNQPFDMPDYSQTFEAPVRQIQHDIQLSDDEFIGTSYPQQKTALQTEPEQLLEQKITQPITEPSWNTSSSSETSANDASPALSDAMNPDLFESTKRVAQSAVEFFDKAANERSISMAVLRVAARTAGETAKASANLVGQDFFNALLRLISYADEQGKIRSDVFAEIIRDTGDRLHFALNQPSGGVTLLKNITTYINESKELFSKK